MSGNAKIWRFATTILLLGMPGCALFSTGPEIVHATGYHYQAPADWKPLDPGDSDHAFKIPSGNVVAMTSTCNGHPDAPLTILTRQLLFGARNVKLSDQKSLSLRGVEALRTEVHDTLDGKPFHLIIVVLSTHSCVFDFSLVSNKPISERDDQQFMSLVQSFSMEKRAGKE